MKNHNEKAFGTILLISLGLGFSQEPRVYKTVPDCMQINDIREQAECVETVTGKKNSEGPPRIEQAPKQAGIYDTTVSYSINEADTTKSVIIQKRVDFSESQRDLGKLASATVFIAVMQGLSAVAGVVTLFVVINK